MTLSVSITFPNSSTLNRPPSGYHLRRVKRWGADAVMVKAGFSTSMQLVNGQEVGQFAFVTPYGQRVDGSWVGSWSAVANFSRLTHEDMLKIAAWQQADETYNVSQKMNYLYHELGTDNQKVAETWGIGEWDAALSVNYGHMVHAGQIVAVSDVLENVFCQMPNETGKRWVPMRELLLFRRADFAKSPVTHPWLIQRATWAGKGDSYGDAPRGIVYMCVMLDPRDFAANNRMTRALMPVEWME